MMGRPTPQPGEADRHGWQAGPTRAAVAHRGRGHGKIILIGEHAVVHGYPALAAGIAAGVEAGVRPGTGRLAAPGWGLDACVGDGTPVGQALELLLRRAGRTDLDVDIEAGIPTRAGLGSSAAMSVAIARAAARACGRDEADVLGAVAEAEAIFHGQPSGIDAAAATSGAVGRFRRGEGWRPVPVLQPMTICVGLTGRPRDTASLVEAVGRLRARTPAVDDVMRAMAAAADAGVAALAVGDVDGLGRLLDLAHGLLAALRVSTPELETLVHGARSAGAVGAKLTGAGGGGAVIALAPGHEQDVLRRWKRDGFDGFLTEIGRPP